MLIEKNIKINDYLKEQYFKISKESIFSLIKLKKSNIQIKEKMENIRRFLEQDNILKEDLLDQKIYKANVENEMFRKLLKNKMYRFLIIYSILRNKMKNIKIKWVEYERKK